jgi:hypothetical protein
MAAVKFWSEEELGVVGRAKEHKSTQSTVVALPDSDVGLCLEPCERMVHLVHQIPKLKGTGLRPLIPYFGQKDLQPTHILSLVKRTFLHQMVVSLLAVAFRLLAAEVRWRRINSPSVHRQPGLAGTGSLSSFGRTLTNSLLDRCASHWN